MRIALAQLNSTVGDVEGNARLVSEAAAEARRQKADLLVTPEMMLLGYPPRDLLFREGVVEAAEAALPRLAEANRELPIVVGHPRRSVRTTRTIRNSASLLQDGAVRATYDKQLLPGYDIFDEDRYFDPGDEPCIVNVGGVKVGVLICEDLWRAGDVFTDRQYALDPAEQCVELGAEVLVALNASPFIIGKHERHEALLRWQARRLGRPIVSVNQVGGNDDLIFDGRSMAVDASGKIIASLPGWRPETRIVEIQPATSGRPGGFESAFAMDATEDESRWTATDERVCEEVFEALRLGVADYCRKTGHGEICVALSGGIDSAATAAIAAAAVGGERVIGVTMPSRYSSPGSIADSKDLAERLKLERCDEISISTAHDAVRGLLEPTLGEAMEGVADENVQARLRGVLIMAYANALNRLVLATGNKSELSVGYATLYGDMSGALAVLGDVSKTRVYALARWMNANHERAGFDQPPIPESTIEKPPSAELRPDQKDEDSLPPYDVLDELIHRYVEREQSVEAIIRETGFEAALVRRFARTIDINQYKRDQAAVVLKVTQRAFGRGRPMPLAMRWRPIEGG